MIRSLPLAVLLSASMLGGCISLLPKPPPPPRMYVLNAGEVMSLQGMPIDAVIGVSNPDGERTSLASDLVWRTGDTIAFVAQSQWATRAQDALQAMLAQTIARQGRFRAAVQTGGARTDYDIRWDVIEFDVVEEGGSMHAQFQADVRVVEAASRRVLAASTFTASAPVSDRSSSIAAQALARAAREGSAHIGEFAANTVATAEAAKAAAAAAAAAQAQSQSSAASIRR